MNRQELLDRLNRLDWASKLVVIAAVITVVFFLWASIARMEEVTHARGMVIAKTRNQVIQSAIDGIIQEVIVEEGQSVKKGQVLAHMERTQAEAAQKDSFGKVAALEAALARLRAEVLGIPLKFPVMNALAQQIGAEDTLVLVTHKPALLRLVDRIVVLTPGGVALDGARDQVLNSLRNPGAAQPRPSAPTKSPS